MLQEHYSPRALVTFDDAGFPFVKEAIAELAGEFPDVPMIASYLVEQMGREDRRSAIQLHRDHPNVVPAIHLDLCVHDVVLTTTLPFLRRTGVLEGFSGSRRMEELCWKQRGRFQEIFRRDPSHLSTHGDWNFDRNGRLYSLFMASMREVFGDNTPFISGEDGMEVVRHYRYRDAFKRLFGRGNLPMVPTEFQQVLEDCMRRGVRIVEFVNHPAISKHPVTDTLRFGELYAPFMRHDDLLGTRAILRSRVIQEAGFEIVSPDQILDER